MERNQISPMVVTRQEAKVSWADHGFPLDALTTAFQQSSAPGDTGQQVAF